MVRSSLHSSSPSDQAARTELRLRLLIQTGLLLASESSLEGIAQGTLDAGLQLSGATLGLFLYSDTGRFQTLKLSRQAGLINTAGASALDSAPPFRSQTTRFVTDLADIPLFAASDSQALQDLAATQETPSAEEADFLRWLTTQQIVRSYLSVPIRGREAHAGGTLVLGHPEPGLFDTDVQSLVETVAAQCALALNHALLQQSLAREVTLAEAARAGERAATRRLSVALEAAQLGTWSWDAATGFIDFDQRGAALFGVEPYLPISPATLRTRLVHGDDLDIPSDDLQAILNAGGQYTSEYRIHAPDAAERWIAATGNATHDPLSGQPIGMIGTLQDITPRKVGEASLRISEKLAATGRLAATIAHEINNPLEAVTNLIYLAKTDPVTPSVICRLLETADTELARVSHIAQQTLGFYRDTTRPISVDLNDLLQAVVDLFDRKLHGKDLHCTLDLEPGLSVVGLQGELRQVVSNLLVNAIDASEASGGNIRIRARARQRNGGRGVAVLVSDQGSGIPYHVRPRLFTPFTTTKQSLGTGLGLWVTQGMVEKHGGSVRFRTRTQSPSGTVFRVYLPETGSPELFPPQSNPILQ